MKNAGTIGAAVVLAVVLLAYMCTFQVRFTEEAIVKTWGKPAREAIREPGLYFKWPRPIQSVVVYDKRLHILEDRTEETRTVDGKNLLVTTFTLWRIKDAAMFHTNFPTGFEEGEKKLRTTVVTHKQAVVGKRQFKDFVSTDPEDRRIREIEKEMMAAVNKDAQQHYGIEIVDFGIKKLGLPQNVTTAIFESMKVYEETKARQYLEEGNARAQDIVANAKAVERRILEEANKKAADIHTEAQAVVSDYYKAFNEHPELRILLDTYRTLKEALAQRTTLILSTEEPPWNMFDPAVRQRFSYPEARETSAVPPALEAPPAAAGPRTATPPGSE